MTFYRSYLHLISELETFYVVLFSYDVVVREELDNVIMFGPICLPHFNQKLS